MAGVGVEAVADFGWAWARARFGADGIVYFDPFWFDVEVRATISAGVEIDTWLGTISFSITTGCGVHVWGPDFSGRAQGRVWARARCRCRSEAGPSARGSSRSGRASSRSTWRRTATGIARAITAITGRGSLPSATGGERSAPTPDGTVDRPFEVYAEFELTVTTSIPTNRFDLGLPGDATVPVVRSDGAVGSLGLNPMAAGGLSSKLTLRLQRLNQDLGRWDDDPLDLAELAANVTAPGPRPEGSRLATGAFPIGVWGPPIHPTPRNPRCRRVTSSPPATWSPSSRRRRCRLRGRRSASTASTSGHDARCRCRPRWRRARPCSTAGHRAPADPDHCGRSPDRGFAADVRALAPARGEGSAGQRRTQQPRPGVVRRAALGAAALRCAGRRAGLGQRGRRAPRRAAAPEERPRREPRGLRGSSATSPPAPASRCGGAARRSPTGVCRGERLRPRSRCWPGSAATCRSSSRSSLPPGAQGREDLHPAAVPRTGAPRHAALVRPRVRARVDGGGGAHRSRWEPRP